MILYQPQSGYCFNSDSIFLYDFIMQLNPRGDILDVGAGCGVVGLLVARDAPHIKLDAVEKQKDFLVYAKKNAQINNIAYNLIAGDFLQLPLDKKYDYIISNPPFYPAGVQKSNNEMLYNARYNIHLPLGEFFKKVSQLLKPKSHCVFCYDATQFGDICNALIQAKMRIVDVEFVHPKKDRAASLVIIHARNGSKSMMKVWPPLIHFEGDHVSAKVKKIYEKAATQSIKCQI